jgi:hypothetical protein
METPKSIITAVAAIKAAAQIRVRDLEQAHNTQQKILDRVAEIERELAPAAAAPAVTKAAGTVTAKAATGAELLKSYRALSGEARQKFYDQNTDAIWEALRLERAAKSSS